MPIIIEDSWLVFLPKLANHIARIFDSKTEEIFLFDQIIRRYYYIYF
jgi:hypothetical protein